MIKRVLLFLFVLFLAATLASPLYAWDNLGHMAVAYVAYMHLTPQARKRANDLIKLNPKYDEWAGWLPAASSAADKDMMIFMLASTWADEIKGDSTYTKDGASNGNRPDGSPNPTANTGYDDKLMHKYWHFVDTPFSIDGTPLPPIPTPDAQERIALFRRVLKASDASDPLKSFDLVWLLHLVGDVHQPLHCSTRVSATDPEGDNGGNNVKLSCPGCASNLHAYWDDLLGTAPSARDAIAPAIIAAKKLRSPNPVLAAKADEKDWIAEGLQAAEQTVYHSPIGPGDGPFSLTKKYGTAATRLARKRVALAAVRLANLINSELK